MGRYKASTMRTALLFLASVAAASAWAGVLAPSAHMTLRTMRCREGSCATAAVVESADGASGMTDALRLDRRAMLKFASKVAATPPLAAAVTWPTVSVAETLDKDTAEAIGKVPLDVLKAIAGGSEKEFKSKLGEYESDLAGIELALFQAYMYGSDKLPEPEDPRASLRPLFQSKMSDGLIKYAEANGITPKVYDARGDGLTNTGKGGVLKGSKVLLEGLKKKGLLEDFTLDTSAHDENSWQQGTGTSSISITVKKPVGLAANKALEEYEDPIQLSLVGNALSGYLRQCKVVPEYKVASTKDGEKIDFTLSWAGKARLKKDIQRRANDKFNTARAFKKDDKKSAAQGEE